MMTMMISEDDDVHDENCKIGGIENNFYIQFIKIIIMNMNVTNEKEIIPQQLLLDGYFVELDERA
jgi:hypothetical protein